VRQRDLFLSIGIAILFLWLVACGGGGRSPTDPGPGQNLPSVAGSWTGSWSVGNVGLRSGMTLAQDANEKVTGTLTILGDSRRIEGTVTPTRFFWHLANSSACPGFVGNFDLTLAGGTVTMMSGLATQDSRDCFPDGTVVSGPMLLSRSGQ
jgi:hypothetical protein